MIPQFLYHYTSIEALAYILKNRTIRFNSLSHVDDLKEGDSEDYKSVGRYFFVSCWTDLEEESIPFWNMYTNDMKGVRIKLPTDLFNSYIIMSSEEYGLELSANNSIVSQEVTFGMNHWIVPTHNNYLQQVLYTNEIAKLKPTLKKVEGDQFTLSFNKIGIHKATHWAFQSEWRYIIKILPFAAKPQPGNGSDLLKETLIALERGDTIPFTYLDIKVNEERLKRMEIVLGPKSSEADKLIVESIVERFNPSANVRESDLSGSIR